MHARLILALLFLGTSAVLFLDPRPGLTQGKGGKGMGMFGGDPMQMFERLAKDRGYFLISETRMLREPLTQYAQKNGITDEKITKEHFLRYNEEMKKTLSSGTFNFNMFKGPFSPPGSASPATITIPSAGNPGAFNPVEAFKAMADAEFKRKDTNEDGKLNQDEMPGSLRDDLARWDTNRDGQIDIDEFRAYFINRMQERMGLGDKKDFNPVASILMVEEDLDRRPDVIRAGKIPKEVTTLDGRKIKVPEWFEQMDTDKDGQVSLYEWRKAGKSIDEFKTWDRNDDGLLTVQEVVFREALALNGSKNGNGSVSSPGLTLPTGAYELGKKKFGDWGKDKGGDRSKWKKPRD